MQFILIAVTVDKTKKQYVTICSVLVFYNVVGLFFAWFNFYPTHTKKQRWRFLVRINLHFEIFLALRRRRFIVKRCFAALLPSSFVGAGHRHALFITLNFHTRA